MAIGLDADTESARRSSIPSGTAGTLSDGGFKNCFVGVWLYRPSAGNSLALTSSGAILHFKSGAREVKLGFDNTFGSGDASGPLLQVIFNSGGGTGADQTFSGANFLDEWVYYFILDNSTSGQIAGYIRLSNLSSAVTITRANDNAGSQYINTLTFGNFDTNAETVFGHYAYARARYATGITVADVLAAAASSSPIAGDWGFWPLDNNTDTGDDSGNGRALTFSGTLTSQTSPTLGGGTTSTTATAAAGAASASAAGSSKAASAATAAAGVATSSASSSSSAATSTTSAAGAASASATGSSVAATTATAAPGVASSGAAGSSLAAAVASSSAGSAAAAAAASSLAAADPGAAAGAAVVAGIGASIAATSSTAAAGVATTSAMGSSATSGATDAVPAAGAASSSAAGSSSAAAAAIAASGAASTSAIASAIATASAGIAAGVAAASAASSFAGGNGATTATAAVGVATTGASSSASATSTAITAAGVASTSATAVGVTDDLLPTSLVFVARPRRIRRLSSPHLVARGTPRMIRA